MTTRTPPPSSPAPGHLLQGPFLALCCANFLFFFGVAMFHLLARHLRALGANEAGIGAIMGCFGVASVLMIPLTGSLTGRWGRRPFVVAGYALTAIMSFAWLLFPSLSYALAVLRALQGVAFAWALVGSATMVVDLAPPGRLAQAIGLFGASGLITNAVGPALAEALASRWGFHAVFATAGALGLIGVAMLGWVSETHRAEAEASPTPILSLALRRGPRGPLLANLVGATGFGAVFVFLADYAPTAGVPHVSPFFLAFTAAALAVRLFVGGLSDRVGRLRVALPAYLTAAVAVTAFSGLHTPWHLVVLAVVLGTSHGLYYPALNALVIERVEAPLRGKAMALYSMSFNVGVMLSSFGYGVLAKTLGYRTMYLFAGAAVLVATAMLAMDRLPEGASA